jgi:peptidoglycan/xylan/chitin deacetylase (PgdA/CDA1 family)
MSVAKTMKQYLRRQLSHLRRDRPALLIFLFHTLFEDEHEIDAHRLDPQQRFTVRQMREFILYFQQAGYEFPSPGALSTDLKPEGKYILVTFDDGYFNNLRMLPLMQELEVPAVFFITTSNVQRQECFWWDVVHRERYKQGILRADIAREQKSLKLLHHQDIRRHLIDAFGADCFAPWSDTDRPMTVAELQLFAAEPLVTIGNHTSEHYILDNYPEWEVTQQIQQGQTALEQMLGFSPRLIAYPNGNYSQSALDAARSCGLQAGISLEKHKNYLPINWQSDDALHLGRFTLWGTQDISKQCDVLRSDIRL